MVRPTDSTERPEEVFTDLNGNPDDASLPETDDGDLDALLAEKPADKTKEIDDELEVVDEPEPVETEAVAEPEPTAEAAPEPAPEPEPEVVEYDPRDAQILALKAKDFQNRRAIAASAKSQATADLARAKADYLKAEEEGDGKGKVEAWERLADAKIALTNAEGDERALAGEENQLKTEAAALAAKAPKDAEGNPIWDRPVTKKAGAPKPTAAGQSKLVPQFIKANAWYNDPKYAAQAAVLRGLDEGLAAEGKLDKNSPAYFAELGNRFNKIHPGIFKSLDGKPVATGQRKRGNGAGDGNGVPSAAGGGAGTAPTGRVDPKSIRLTRDDIVLMAKFGQEDTPENRRRCLANKRAMAAQGVM